MTRDRMKTNVGLTDESIQYEDYGRQSLKNSPMSADTMENTIVSDMMDNAYERRYRIYGR